MRAGRGRRAGAAREAPPPSDHRAILSNATKLVASRYGVAALSWLGTLLIVRHLSQADWGQFSFVFSLLGLLAIVTDLSIGPVAIRGILDGERDPGRFAGAYVTLRAALGLLGYLLALAFVTLASYPAVVVETTAIAGVVVLIATPSRALDVVYQARLQLGTTAVANVMGQAAQLALTVAIVAGRHDSIPLLAVPAVLCEAVIIATKLWRLPRLLAIRFNIDLRTWRELLREAAPLAAGSALKTMYHRIDAIMLSKLDTFAAVGIYGIAYKFVDIIQVVPQAIIIPLTTVLVRAAKTDQAAFHETVRRAYLLMAITAGLVLSEFLVFAHPVIQLLYGERYAVGAGAARVVIGGETLTFFTNLGVTILIATSRHRLYPPIALAGVILNVGLNLWLIPEHSYRGTAVATLATEVVVGGAIWTAARRVPGVGPLPWADTARVMLCSAAAGSVGWLAWQILPWTLAAAAGGLVYAGLLVMLGVPGRAGLALPGRPGAARAG